MDVGKLRRNYILKRADIFIYVANQTEYVAIKEFLHSQGIKLDRYIIEEQTRLNFFKFGKYHIVAMVGNKTGPREASNKINEICPKFANLSYIVNIGCCATRKDKVQNDVIFATRIFDADLRKEKETTQFQIGENKNDKMTNIINENISKLSDDNCTIISGPLISSSALISNKEIKNKFLDVYPYADGIEMEGLAISDYAIKKGIDWVVIKGTSDNAIDKNGSINQSEATMRSCKVFFGLLNLNALATKRMNVFISGSLIEKSNVKEEKQIMELGNRLLEKKMKIINGLGYGVGPSLVASVYNYMKKQGSNPFNHYIDLYPFPRVEERTDTINELYHQNRNKMIEQSAIAIYIFGDTNKGGIEEEFKIAGSHFIPRIAIPIKGYKSEELFERMKANEYDTIDDKKYIDLYNSLNAINFSNQLTILLELIQLIDDFLF